MSNKETEAQPVRGGLSSSHTGQEFTQSSAPLQQNNLDPNAAQQRRSSGDLASLSASQTAHVASQNGHSAAHHSIHHQMAIHRQQASHYYTTGVDPYKQLAQQSSVPIHNRATSLHQQLQQQFSRPGLPPNTNPPSLYQSQQQHLQSMQSYYHMQQMRNSPSLIAQQQALHAQAHTRANVQVQNSTNQSSSSSNHSKQELKGPLHKAASGSITAIDHREQTSLGPTKPAATAKLLSTMKPLAEPQKVQVPSGDVQPLPRPAALQHNHSQASQIPANPSSKQTNAEPNSPNSMINQFNSGIGKFLIYLQVTLGNINKNWIIVKDCVNRGESLASRLSSVNPQMENILLAYKDSVMTLKIRRDKLNLSFNVTEATKVDDVRKMFKVVFADVHLLKQACERGVQVYDKISNLGEDVTEQCNNDMIKELKNLQKTFSDVTAIETQMSKMKGALHQVLAKRDETIIQIAQKQLENEKKKVKANSGKNGKRKKSNSQGKNKNGGNLQNKRGIQEEKEVVIATPELKRPIHGPNADIIDENPERLVNPLLELPIPSLATERIVPVSEFLKLMEIFFPEPDTFPLSYYSKILGFDAEEETQKVIEDQWMKIPELGVFGSNHAFLQNSTLDSVDLDGSRRDCDYDCVDPTWVSILNEYRGYKDDYLKQASEMNKPSFLSEECISMAYEIGALSQDITFRVAQMADVLPLCNFAEKQDVYYKRNNFEQIIKSGNQFIIFSLNAEGEIHGFIHYQFCWFRPKLQNPNAIEDVALEKVVHIETVCVDGDIGDNTTEYLTLFSLVIEHSRQYVVYGMMELPSALAPLLTKYFRMSIMEPNMLSEDTFLACDLVKCSFRFAFYLKKEEETRCRTSMEEPETKKFRMLAQFPITRRVTNDKKALESSENQTSTCSDDLHENNTQLFASNKKPGNFLFSAEDHRRHTSQQVVVQISKGQVSASKTLKSSPNASENLPPKKILLQGNWNPISCFESKTSQLLSKDDDFVLKHLKELQAKVKALEIINRSTLKGLYSDVERERTQFETKTKIKRKCDQSICDEFHAEVQRKIDIQKAIEAQQEEDDNAVCDICGDGESSGENRIIFCDSCDVSVHQHCYGVDIVPKGDYFCRACKFFKKNEPTTVQTDKADGNSVHEQIISHIENGQNVCMPVGNGSDRIRAQPPIVCELCPKKSGAFVQTQTDEDITKITAASSRWVHFLCAKWQGLNIVENLYIDNMPIFMIENVQPIKDHFRLSDTRCYLCKGIRGTYNKCRHESCDRWMHVTCARSSGMCEVIHGDDHIGPVDSPNVWTLCCPDHSTFPDDYVPPTNKVSLEELVALAKTYPVEPKPKPPPPPPKAFGKMSGKERKQRLKDPEYEMEFFEIMEKKNIGMRCEFCNLNEEIGEMVRCSKCSAQHHKFCFEGPSEWKSSGSGHRAVYTCNSCAYMDENKDEEDFEPPSCHMCFSKEGALAKCIAKPINLKRWKSNMSSIKKSLFGKQIWCHPVCGTWHPKVNFGHDGTYECSNVIMANGMGHIEKGHRCHLCGISKGLKIACMYQGGSKQCKHKFHATCARQAGLEVSHENPNIDFALMCFNHGRCDFSFRALLEDMIEFEKKRAGNELSRSNSVMSLDCAAQIFNAGVRVLNSLGWAWKWASWWVNYGDVWEPLLEEGQKESDMTKEQLKIVDSTPTSRREDARKCRLAAFGAALRNRDFDKEEGDDQDTLRYAIRAIFNTPSLVGPLSKAEIAFYVDWLSRVYRSKSPRLGLGDKKIPVCEILDEKSPNFFDDKSPKFMLGSRPLPGKSCRPNHIFENIEETDDFFNLEKDIEPLDEKCASISSSKSKSTKKKKSPKPKKEALKLDDTLDAPSSKKKPGRKPGRKPKKLVEPDIDISLSSVSTKVSKKRKTMNSVVASFDIEEISLKKKESPKKGRPGRPKKVKSETSNIECQDALLEYQPVVNGKRARKVQSYRESDLDSLFEDEEESLEDEPPKKRVRQRTSTVKKDDGKAMKGAKRGRPKNTKVKIDDDLECDQNGAFEKERKKESPKKRGRPKGTKAVITNEVVIECNNDQIRGSDGNNATNEKARNTMDAPIPRKVKPNVVNNVDVSEKSLMDQPIPKKVRGRPHKRIQSP